MAQIRIENLHKRFDEFIAVKDSTMTIPDGSFFVLLGPSGCGKTTTLRMIAGLEMPTSGRIMLGDEDVTFRRAAQRDIAFVFQLFALYPHLNVYNNLAYPLKSQGVSRREIADRINEVARLLRIEDLLKARPSKLAGGDRQRVALGRAIVRRPKAFLMDEPLGTLDTEFRDLMCQELRQLHNRIGATTVYVTHDQVEAMSMGDYVAVMNGGEILQVGTPNDVYDRPSSVFVADFIGNPPMNMLPFGGPIAPGSDKVSVAGADVSVPVLKEGLVHDSGILGARPEHIMLSDSAALRGRVFGVEYTGARKIVAVDTDVGRVRVRASNTVDAQTGDTVGLDFLTSRLSLFDAKSEAALTLSEPGERHG